MVVFNYTRRRVFIGMNPKRRRRVCFIPFQYIVRERGAGNKTERTANVTGGDRLKTVRFETKILSTGNLDSRLKATAKR